MLQKNLCKCLICLAMSAAKIYDKYSNWMLGGHNKAIWCPIHGGIEFVHRRSRWEAKLLTKSVSGVSKERGVNFENSWTFKIFKNNMGYLNLFSNCHFLWWDGTNALYHIRLFWCCHSHFLNWSDRKALMVFIGTLQWIGTKYLKAHKTKWEQKIILVGAPQIKKLLFGDNLSRLVLNSWSVFKSNTFDLLKTHLLFRTSLERLSPRTSPLFALLQLILFCAPILFHELSWIYS